MKSRPRLVDPRFIAPKWTEPLRLLFILRGFPKIAGIAVKHTCHMISARAVGTESNRFLSGSHGILVSALKQACIAQCHVCLIAVRVDCQSTSCALQCRFVGC